MSEQMAVPATGGLLTLNLTVSPQNDSMLGLEGRGLFSGFSAIMSEQSGGRRLVDGALLPSAGTTLPQTTDNGQLAPVSMQQKMLYIAQILEQQYGEEAALPTGITTELAQALKQFAEQQSTSAAEADNTFISSNVENDDVVTPTIVGSPVLLSEIETNFEASLEELNAWLNDIFDKGVFVEPEKIKALHLDSAETRQQLFNQLEETFEHLNADVKAKINEVINASDMAGDDVHEQTIVQVVRAIASEDVKLAQLQAQRIPGDRLKNAQPRVIEMLGQAGSAAGAKQGHAILQERASSSVEEAPRLSVKTDFPDQGRVKEKLDLVNMNASKDTVPDFTVKSDITAKVSPSIVQPERFESTLELSKQLLQKVTSTEKSQDNSFNQRIETLITAQQQAIPQPSLAQKAVADATNLMMPQQVQINTPAWKNALGERAIMLSAQNMNVAHIQLDPPELGSLSIRVNINQDQVSLSFTSPHAHVRDAVEQSLPRLREMFAEQGLSLQDSSVADQSADQQRREQLAEQGSRMSGDSLLEGSDLGDDELVSLASQSLSLVDYYA